MATRVGLTKEPSAEHDEEVVIKNPLPFFCTHCDKNVMVEAEFVRTPCDGDGWFAIVTTRDGVHRIFSACGTEENALAVIADSRQTLGAEAVCDGLPLEVQNRLAAANPEWRWLCSCSTELNMTDDELPWDYHAMAVPTSTWWPKKELGIERRFAGAIMT